ncbi:MAG: DUF1836 domain-containing protein [Clostridia bacterium]|nr:DUF1836 domain-containing protein [Clostridia bacterium]
MSKSNNSNDNLTKIQKTLENFCLPTWDELPPIYLYMDQVIELTAKYFGDVSVLMGEEKVLTAPMINNYIKLKAMPAPIKKRYGKIHLAYILMISSLKQCMNISAMKSIIPLSDDENEVRRMYESFICNQRSSLSTLREIMTPIIEKASGSDKADSDTILQIVLSANLMKVFTYGFTATDDEGDNSQAKSKTKQEDDVSEG